MEELELGVQLLDCFFLVVGRVVVVRFGFSTLLRALLKVLRLVGLSFRTSLRLEAVPLGSTCRPLTLGALPLSPRPSEFIVFPL